MLNMLVIKMKELRLIRMGCINIHFVVALIFIITACTPGPVGTKRYQPYTGVDSAIIYTQVNERHRGLVFLQRFEKNGDCFEEADMIYISNNFMDGGLHHFMESRIQANKYWSLYVLDNSSGRQILRRTAFIPEAGKRYVGIDYQGAVEIPQELKISSEDDLDEIYTKYKNKQAMAWNLRSGQCKTWIGKLMEPLISSRN